MGYSGGSVSVVEAFEDEEKGRPYVTVEAESDELASDKRWRVRRMRMPTSRVARDRWLGSRIISYGRADALDEES